MYCLWPRVRVCNPTPKNQNATISPAASLRFPTVLAVLPSSVYEMTAPARPAPSSAKRGPAPPRPPRQCLLCRAGPPEPVIRAH